MSRFVLGTRGSGAGLAEPAVLRRFRQNWCPWPRAAGAGQAARLGSACRGTLSCPSRQMWDPWGGDGAQRRGTIDLSCAGNPENPVKINPLGWWSRGTAALVSFCSVHFVPVTFDSPQQPVGAAGCPVSLLTTVARRAAA